MKPCQHQWRDDDAPVEICQLCNDFRPWQETVKTLRLSLKTANEALDKLYAQRNKLIEKLTLSEKSGEVLAQTGIDVLERANTAERKIEQMRETLIVARDCIVFGNSLDEENNKACAKRALDKIDEVLDQSENITADDAEYLRGEPVPLDIQIPIEIEGTS